MDFLAQLPRGLSSLVPGVSLAVVVTGVAKAFEWLDPMVSDKGRKALAHWLSNAPDDAKIDSWATVFPNLIDRVFGTRALSLKFFVRSCIASLIAITIVALLYYALVVSHYGGSSLQTILLLGIILGSIANLFPDYVSILVTRTIVRLLEKNPTPMRVGVLLVLDTALTAAVAEAAIYFVLVLTVGLVGLVANHSLTLVMDFLRTMSFLKFLLIAFKPGFYQSLFSIFFFSAFFTSVWLWLYVLSIGLIRTAHRARLLWVRVVPFLDIENKPLVAIGRVAGLLVGAFYVLILSAVWLARNWH